MREQNQKISLQDFATFPRDWTRSVTTVDSGVSKNRGEKQYMIFRKIKHILSAVFRGTELRSSKLTLNL